MEERSKIAILHQEGYPVNQITKLLNRHRSTIYRELGRCVSGAYQASTAHMDERQRDAVPLY
ncbi:helix-turn-helix domain-containing protein [Eremococcus coleocola]|uniref:helix-turn-helix domain-containing protein n=1 Tax=Eremococcus coleocola TaxID=88132 RepID=UPI0009DB7A5F